MGKRNMAPSLLMAWRNLWRHRRRTWLTTSAMVFANALLIFAVCLQFGTYQMMIDNSLRLLTGHLQVQAVGYLDQPRLRTSIPAIAQRADDLRAQLHTPVAARAVGFALVSSAQRSFGMQILGVQPEFEPGLSTLPGQIVAGRYLKRIDPQAILIGSIAARNLKVGLGDELTLLGSGRDGSFAAGVAKVVGIYQSGMAEADRSLAQITLGEFQSLFAMEGHGHQLVLRAGSLTQVEDLKHTTEALLQSDPNLVVLDWNALLPGVKQAIQADLASSWFMYGVLIILVAFSVLNTQLMAVLERTHEFGIMLSLGLKPRRLAQLVLLETGLMAGLGWAIGIVLGLLIALYLARAGLTFPGMEAYAEKFNLEARMYPQVSLFAVLIGPSIVFAASLLAALYPALRLLRLTPMKALQASTT